MSVGILVITHDDIGKALLDSAHSALGQAPLPSGSVSASRDCDPEELLKSARQALASLDSGAGVLVLTDLFGATPSNMAERLLHSTSGAIRIVTGVNLPMLIRVLNYPTLDLNSLTAKAVSGGKDGVFEIHDSLQEPR